MALGLVLRVGAGFVSEVLALLESRVMTECIDQTGTLLRVKRGTAVISYGRKVSMSLDSPANLPR